MKIPCDVVTDLLPLYHDGVCNQSTKKLVAEHLEECESCRVLLDKISNTTIDNKIKAESKEVIKHQAKALKMRYAKNIGAVIFSSLLLLGIITCVIVDLAISGTLTWSLIPISSIVFTWCSFFPAIKYGAKGITVSLIALSVLIAPYLFVLNRLVGGQILQIAIWMAIVGVVFMWVVFVVFKLLKSRKLLASAISLILTIPVSLVINLILSRIISESIFDVWDAMSFALIAIVAGLLFYLDYAKRKRARLG
jgi:predicted anti-sigma-YlaC factor YlaD